LLWAQSVRPDSSGYDFDSISNIAQWDTLVTTDIYFALSGSIPELVVNQPKVRIQDYGWVGGFDFINRAPDDIGWAPSGKVEAIEEHCYIVRLGESDGVHYAKLYVWDVTSSYIRFWWAYQSDPYNRDLAPPPGATDGKGIIVERTVTAERGDVLYRGSQLVDGFPPLFCEGNEYFKKDDL
jgi:hypothetical protein